MSSPILKYFTYKHEGGVSVLGQKHLCELALKMDAELPDGPEKSAGLRKLLEAKDCFVRATL